ncbi:hypothetical protein STAS_29014 [Striga asiatica]|uniref:Uncharacterized protein n=1 Tax=Striga asiatica TaxID=4170 RepID=A0A5A7R5P2_STRAF|nr:hypothetical protein STAS_29014 [Striga asiatica]
MEKQPEPVSPLLCLSPNSRRKSIASGQRELMEMLKDMPESSYELSLQDLVEHHRQKMEIDDVEGPHLQNRAKNRAVFVKKVKRHRGFEDRGLFLKMGFPFNLQSRKVKRIGDSSNSMSPKPERDWWKKKFTGSNDSESSRISSDSGRSYGGGSQSVSSIEIEEVVSSNSTFVQSDGEFLGFLPKKFSILPGAVEMIC